MLQINMALNQPTFMSSMFSDPMFGDYYSSRAVDGNKDPMALKLDNSCVVTQSEPNPWWAVDLGSAFSVAGVVFSNRDENQGIQKLTSHYTTGCGKKK